MTERPSAVLDFGAARRPIAKSLVLAHPTANQNVRQALSAFHRAGLLAEFWTSVAWNPPSIINALVPRSLAAQLHRRSFPEVPHQMIRTEPWTEMGRLSLNRLGIRAPFKLIADYFTSDAVSERLDLAVARRLPRSGNLSGVYASDDAALHSFTAAKRMGIKCVYDLPIGYWRAYREVFQEETELVPEWAETLSGQQDSPEKLDRKDRELALADAIIVASAFTEKTLAMYPHPLRARVIRIPYGAPPVSPPRRVTSPREPLRVLFVGALTQRKGISYLIEAVEKLEHPYELTLVGQPTAIPAALARALNRHRWIPTAPHGEVLRIMRAHDVLVFPSLFEGFGLVLLEAMSQGMAVVTTGRTAGTEILDDGVDGFLVPLRSPAAIAGVLTRLAEDRDLLASISSAAQEKARAFSWNRYQQEIVRTVTHLLAG